ncbi:16S rRNA (cytidine(1402)-2'-O)-methyltransferase [Eudoraea chungangensis]|uniref:16S rRNA (cytidine(1402)-2'-O)-methyltransferase n=1 Tax=Eudoraea chungangensis TaxID=1481905 RepID=UPI0023EC3E69|nr:16S rRNA (cytidine(1402)-2'-O)-methyltransferase [Eudoraea chungangensis]
MSGRLYLVPTPIGNLEDITLRALKVLKEVDLILAEDTRTSKKLLSHYNIDTPMQSYHMFNEHKTLDGIILKIKAGAQLAIISDAGTPAISDPGFLLTRACIKEGFEVQCLPGATAFVPALVNSGLPSDRFVFEGFLPLKKGRQTRLKELAVEPRTVIIYESPHKLVKTLLQFQEYFGEDRLISISRELSKLYEETIRGSIAEVMDHFANIPPKGEFVIIVSGYKEKKK